MQAGIVGGTGSGAESIVLSGGYTDDEDHGDEIIYTGDGGRDPRTGRQIRLALKRLEKELPPSFGRVLRWLRPPD